MNAYDIILQPWLTEKSMEARTSESRLEFLVRRGATKEQIARAVETIFEVEVAPPGTKVLIHKKSNVRGSCDYHGVEGWYIGSSLEH